MQAAFLIRQVTISQINKLVTAQENESVLQISSAIYAIRLWLVNPKQLTGEMMPEKKIPNQQMCTAKHAIAIYNAFSSAGVPVSNLLENNLTEGEVAVLNNPNFEDDGGQHQYLMNLWGKQMVVTVADEFMQGAGGAYECLVHLAQQAMVNSSVAPGQNQAVSLTYQQAEELIFGLPGFAQKLTAAINYNVID